MATAPVKVGIVGLGRWAKVLARASQSSDALEIVAAYSRTEANARHLRENSACRRCPSSPPCWPTPTSQA